MSGQSDPESGQRRDTHRGLGEVEAGFTPSDSNELRPSFDPAYPDGRPEHEVKLPSSPKVPAIEDLVTGTQEMTPERRALFDTSMGGGANRVSGGREAARAYVAPRTPRPVLFHSQDTMSIEVAERSNQFDTVPSLSRRKLARILGEPASGTEGRSSDRGVNLWFVMGLALFGGIFLVFLANRESREPDRGAQTSSAPKAASPVAPPSPAEKRAPAAKPVADAEPAVIAKEPELQAPVIGVEPVQAKERTAPSAPPAPAPEAQPMKASASKPSKSKSKASTAKDDLWLE